MRLALLGVFLHSEAYRSEAEHGFNGNHPPPPFPFPFPFSFSFPVESRGWLLSSLHSSSPSSATNEQHGREASKQSEGVGEKWVGCFDYYAFRFFSGMGRHNNVINAAFPFLVFFFRVGKLMMHG